MNLSTILLGMILGITTIVMYLAFEVLRLKSKVKELETSSTNIENMINLGEDEDDSEAEDEAEDEDGHNAEATVDNVVRRRRRVQISELPAQTTQPASTT